MVLGGSLLRVNSVCRVSFFPALKPTYSLGAEKRQLYLVGKVLQGGHIVYNRYQSRLANEYDNGFVSEYSTVKGCHLSGFTN